MTKRLLYQINHRITLRDVCVLTKVAKTPKKPIETPTLEYGQKRQTREQCCVMGNDIHQLYLIWRVGYRLNTRATDCVEDSVNFKPGDQTNLQAHHLAQSPIRHPLHTLKHVYAQQLSCSLKQINVFLPSSNSTCSKPNTVVVWMGTC